jgi:CRP-like cAMP-binding protein
MTNLLSYINSITDLPEKKWDSLYPALTTIEFKRGQFLLKTGKICDSLSLVNKGYCRAFYDKNEQEINTAFFFENDMATNINSFTKEEKSDFSIQACEDLIVIQFDKKKLYEASKKDLDIEILGKKCLQQIAAKQEKHSALYKLMSAQERYEYLEEYSPEILQRVPLIQLASYLGVARETLSRIRSRR